MLDAYQHFPSVPGNRVEGTSSSGARKLAVFGNCPGDIYDWSGIRTYTSLRERTFSLSDEDPAAPMLMGTADLPEGSSRTCQVTLRPMLSRISLHSIGCDFSQRPYAGQRLQNVRAYLTYASDACRPLDPDYQPVSWINAGGLDEAETAALAHPEMVFAEVSPSLGGRIYPDLDFYCYPNPSDGETFGQPVTRLVIEGTLLGTTYYYPIDLPGLEAAVHYQLDITLTRTGTRSADVPAEDAPLFLECRILDWDGRQWDDIHYQ